MLPLQLSPLQPICCDKKNRSRNQKKTHNVNEPLVITLNSQAKKNYSIQKIKAVIFADQIVCVLSKLRKTDTSNVLSFSEKERVFVSEQ